MKTRRSGKVSEKDKSSEIKAKEKQLKSRECQLDRKKRVSGGDMKTRSSVKVSEKDKSSEIEEKLKEIESKEKQLKSREGQLDRENKKLTKRFRELEAGKEELALREKQFEGRRKELELFTLEVEEDRDTVADQFRELESRDVQLRERVLAIEQIRQKFEADRKKLEEKQLDGKSEADWKKLEERIHEVDQKEMQLGVRARSLDLLSQDLARQYQEIGTNRRKIEADSKLLDEKVKGFDLRSMDLERQHKDLEGKIESSWKKLDERICELDHRERGLDWATTDLDRERKELESTKRKLEADQKKLEERFSVVNLREKQLEGGLEDLEIGKKDLCRQRKELESDKKKVEADRKESDETARELEVGRNLLEEENRKLETEKHELNLDRQKLDEQFREVEIRIKKVEENNQELESSKRELRGQLEQVKLKENRLDAMSKEIGLCKKIVMDGKTLQNFLNECWQNHEKMGGEVSFLLGLSDDPAKLVLDALEGFFPPHFMKNGIVEFAGHTVQRSCILLLEQLLKISPDLKPEIKNEAMRLSSDWITRLKADAEHFTEILGFLLILANYGLASNFDADELFNYVKTVAHCEQVPNLCAILGMADKIPGLIKDLVERKQHLVATRYASYFNLVEKFPLDSLLKDHLETSKTESAEGGNNSLETQNQATTRNAAPAISCLENDNISSEDSPANLSQLITSPEKHEPERTELDLGVKEFVVDLPLTATTESTFKACIMAEEAPQLQHTGTDFCVPWDDFSDFSDNLDPDILTFMESDDQHQADISTEDPLPKRRKLMDGKNTSMENAGSKIEEEEEEECGSGKDLRGVVHQNVVDIGHSCFVPTT